MLRKEERKWKEKQVKHRWIEIQRQKGERDTGKIQIMRNTKIENWNKVNKEASDTM